MAIEGVRHQEEGDSEDESGEESSGDESYDYGFAAGALSQDMECTAVVVVRIVL